MDGHWDVWLDVKVETQRDSNVLWILNVAYPRTTYFFQRCFVVNQKTRKNTSMLPKLAHKKGPFLLIKTSTIEFSQKNIFATTRVPHPLLPPPDPPSLIWIHGGDNEGTTITRRRIVHSDCRLQANYRSTSATVAHAGGGGGWHNWCSQLQPWISPNGIN